MNDTKAERVQAMLAVGFATTVAMWAVGYVGRLPAVVLPSPLLLPLMLGCLFGGGMWIGRHTGRGFASGADAGLVSGLLNLLVLGSFLGADQPDRIVPSALLWLPGSILASLLIAGAGGRLGSRRFAAAEPFRDWSGAMVRVSVVATLLLLGVGGLVTSAEAGLAVVDWPRSFGYNMFLYPFSRMTGGIYYEHAHRLFGALVGLTILFTALVLQRAESRRWVRRLAWATWFAVVVQGLFGGFRVTEVHLGLAMIHAVLGQMILAALVALAVFTSATWRGPATPLYRLSARTDRRLGATLVGLLLGQLVLGAAQRHFATGLIVHMISGIAIVTPMAIHVGIRAWGLNVGQVALQRLGLGLIGALCVQIVLGLGAFAATGSASTLPRALDLTLATAHQWVGAVILSTAVALLCLEYRLLELGSEPTQSPIPRSA